VTERPVAGAGGEIFSECVWLPHGEVLSRVFVLHGMGASGGEYAPLGEYLAERGTEVHALNFRSGARDPLEGRRGHAFDFGLLREDFILWVDAVCAGSPLPVFLLGESMGALLAIRFLSEEKLAARFRGAVLLCPVTGLARPTPVWQKRLLRWVSVIFPRMILKPSVFVSGKKEELVLTSDAEYQNYLRTMPHRIPHYTVRFLAGVDWLMEESHRVAPSVFTPFFLLNGEDDVFIRPNQAREWFEKTGATDRKQTVYKDCNHLLLHEKSTGRVLEDIGRWICGKANGRIED